VEAAKRKENIYTTSQAKVKGFGEYKILNLL